MGFTGWPVEAPMQALLDELEDAFGPGRAPSCCSPRGIVMSKSWPVGGWLGTKKAKDRVVATLEAARPLNAWIADHVRAPAAG